MRRALRVVLVGASAAVLAALAGCDDGGTEPDRPTSVATQTSPTRAAASVLIGSWHRAQSCQEMLAAFAEAGLAESHRDWLQGNFFDGKPGPIEGDQCAGAHGPLEHDHFFTADGGFGSHDQEGEEVDAGDFSLVDTDTVRFPSHAAEFGYSADILADFSVNGDVLTFTVALPEPCDEKCADAYAWALSAFASGPWERGEAP